MTFTPGIIFLLIVLGFAVGTVGGMVGIGGGVIIIPLLMFVFGFTQAKANGTSLAMMLPPIGVFAVLSYWQNRNIDLGFAGLLAVGFAAGAYLGATIVNREWINPTALRIMFAIILMFTAARILFPHGGRARAALETSLLVGSYTGTYCIMRLLGRHWKRSPSQWGSIYRHKRHGPLEYDYEI